MDFLGLLVPSRFCMRSKLLSQVLAYPSPTSTLALNTSQRGDFRGTMEQESAEPLMQFQVEDAYSRGIHK